jgi:hypothetical protein
MNECKIGIFTILKRRQILFKDKRKKSVISYEKQYPDIIFVFSFDEPTLPIPPLNYPNLIRSPI